MRRRALLGTLASLAVAGCTGTGAQPSGSDSTTTKRTTSTTSTTRTTTVSDATPEELLTLGIPTTQSDCPLGDEGRAVCYPEQTPAVLSLTPADDALDLPTDSTTFTLANDTDHEYHANFYGWKLSKRVEGEWFHVAPQFWNQPLHLLPAGESHEWSFTVDNEQVPSGGGSSDEDITLAGLGGGEYAFTLQGWFPLGDDHDSFHVALGARFELLGDPVELTPTADVSASRDGDTVVVTTDAEPGEDEELSAFVVERSGVPPERPIEDRITEQLLRPSHGSDDAPLRNTISFFEEGVQTVRLEAPDATIPPFGVDEPQYVRYEGETYKVSTKRVD